MFRTYPEYNYHTRQPEFEYRLAFRSSLYIVRIKQFNNESVDWEIR